MSTHNSEWESCFTWLPCCCYGLILIVHTCTTFWWYKQSEYFTFCLTHSGETVLFVSKRLLILAQPISFVPGATSEWLTPSALSLLTTMRSTPPCTATEPTGDTGTSTASSTWPCSVCGLLISLTPIVLLLMCICLWEHELFWRMCEGTRTPVFMRLRADCVWANEVLGL